MPVQKYKQAVGKIPELFDAIQALTPGAVFSMRCDQSTDLENYNTIEWMSEDQAQPSYEAASAKLVELNAAYAAEEYSRLRFTAYPSIEAQLGMLYDDIAAGTALNEGTWFNAIKAVKEANPKS